MSDLLQIDDDFEMIVDGYQPVTLRSFGSQLLSNGKFNQQTTDWIEVTTGTGLITTEDNAANISVGASGLAILKQHQDSIPLASKQFHLSFDLFALTDSMSLSIEDSDANTLVDLIYNTDGRKVIDLTPTFSTFGLRVFFITGALNSSFTIDNVLLQERTETQVTKAFVHQNQSQEAEPTGGASVSEPATFYLPAAQLVSDPQVADTLIDSDGREWRIISTKKNEQTDAWRCETQRLSINPDLAQTVTLQKALISKDAQGAEQKNYQNWVTDLQVVIQPQQKKIEFENQNTHDPEMFSVYLQDPLELDHRYQFVTAENELFDVISSQSLNQLDQFQEVTVEKV